MIAFANVKFCLSLSFLSLSLLLVLELYSPAASVFWLRACWQTERKDRYRSDLALAYQYRSICHASICPVLLHRSNCLLGALARSLSLSLTLSLSPSPSHTLVVRSDNWREEKVESPDLLLLLSFDRCWRSTLISGRTLFTSFPLHHH